MDNQLSNEFKDLTNWIMDVTKNEISFQPTYDYDIFDTNTGWKITLLKPDQIDSGDSTVFQLMDEKNNIGTQARYTIHKNNFLISALAYWDAAQGRWTEDAEPFERTHLMWSLLRNAPF